LAVELHLQLQAGDLQGHLRRQRLAATERLGGEALGHRLLDLALRVDAHRLEELADAEVEGFLIHGVSVCGTTLAPIMPLTELNHYFVRANDLEQTRRFYCDVLGFEEMPRPDFPFPGHWLGVGGKVQVHMGPHGIEHADRYYLG